jgi:uncharacterized damage-inducible protein DinB
MSNIVEMVAAEFQEESKTTGRVLDRVPADKLGWRPHAKSSSLGQLALHIASVPSGITKRLAQDEAQIDPKAFTFKDPANVEDIRSAFEQGVKDANAFLSSLTEQRALATWTLKAGDKTIVARPRIGVVRMILMNHLYHHRGQLSVYLRMLDVPVPSIYGPSADENPF